MLTVNCLNSGYMFVQSQCAKALSTQLHTG